MLRPRLPGWSPALPGPSTTPHFASTLQEVLVSIAPARLIRKVVIFAFAICALTASGWGVAAAQEPASSVAKLAAEPAIARALASIKTNEPQVIADQIEITQVAAPPFKESLRAQLLKRKFEAAGLKEVRIDAIGNVIGVRPGAATRPNLVLAAHLDTVFPEGTDVTVKKEGAILRAPGVGDDGRGLAVLLGVIRALEHAGIKTAGTITFVADVGEEGLGDLRGTRELFTKTLKGQIDQFISIDGTSHGITNVAVGSYRYRVTVKGPGGHSYGAFGLANPIHALGRAIGRIADIQVPAEPKTTFNVGRIGGGTSVNSIASEAWMEMDMRSSDPASLKAVDAKFRDAVTRSVAEENARWGKGLLTADMKLVGERPAGRTPETARIVQTGIAVNKLLGLPVSLGEGSTDSNIPMSLGVPAMTIGGGGAGSGAHSPGESFDTTDSWKGTERVLLTVLALAR